MIETNRIEFKRQLTRDMDIEKEVIAFLNYREGGIIYIGVDDNGQPVENMNIDGDMLAIKNRLRDNIMPSPMGLFDVTTERISGVSVIRLFVSSGSEKPYYKKQYGLSPKGCFIRVGTAAEPMTQAQIEEIFSHRVRRSLKHIPSPRKDLTFRQLHIYYDSKHLTLNDNFAQNLELLTDDGRFNYVANLLADENSTSIKVAKYAGKDRVDLIGNYEYGYCSLLKASERVLDRLHVENSVKSTIGYPYRTDTPLWNERAVRELVINAIVHNDYFNEVPPKFEIFSNRLEITSTGSLPDDMSKEDFFGGVSNPRNKELMRVFRDVELVESLGTGLQRVLQVYGKECFVFMDHFIRVVIPFAWLPNEENHPKTDDSTLKEVPNSTQKKEIRPKEAPNSTQKKRYNTSSAYIKVRIMELLKNDSSLTRKRLAEALEMTQDQIKWHLQMLQETGYLRRVGGRKEGHWEIIG